MKKHSFVDRHTGVKESDYAHMLETIGNRNITELLDQAVPSEVRGEGLSFFDAHTEEEALKHLDKMGKENKIYKTYIGKGYYGTIMPSVIRRNVFENPGWYTAYTPYQAEISQGRLEAILNFQTMACDLTGMEVANASLLDESTAVAEGAIMIHRFNQRKRKNADTLLIVGEVFAQTLAVVKTRLSNVGLKLKQVATLHESNLDNSIFGVMVQYPAADGQVVKIEDWLDVCVSKEIPTVIAADIMALTILKAPGNFGADVVVGSSQRFGIPIGFGGPHAAFFTAKEKYKRVMPGRIIGLSKDKAGNRAYRMSLQTREQHIKRDKATSNICTSQVLLAVMASMYAIYHGNKGLTAMANDIHHGAKHLAEALTKMGFSIKHSSFFDTIAIVTAQAKNIQQYLWDNQINVFATENEVHISLDETTTKTDIEALIQHFQAFDVSNTSELKQSFCLAEGTARIYGFLNQKIFNYYHTETEMMRYIKKLERKDISLNLSMISLGSCTMKLNPATTMLPLMDKHWANIHPMVPKEQCQGYWSLIKATEDYLMKITRFSAISMQPNSGAQGEYAGLLSIKKYLESIGEQQRNICLIPDSAHGTNPASAIMAGMKVVVVKSNANGEIDLVDLKEKTEKYKNNLAALMVTYPSTHGVFEIAIKEITQLIHDCGGQVYMDGANMNAQIGLTSPFEIGADVCHLNLHKTFAIPHGGGGPGVGSIGVAAHLVPFKPQFDWEPASDHDYMISGSPWGSALILLIPFSYMYMLGSEGLALSTERAILNANYLKARLSTKYPILYTNANDRVAHEFILDCRGFKEQGIDAIAIGKRLMDYGFHAPTVSFPVANTLMIEPTESESLHELDRFVEAMLSIYQEIEAIGKTTTKEDNPIVNAPHIQSEVCGETWTHPYPRMEAAFPLPYVGENKVWPSVGRIDEAYGDRNLICACDPIEDYALEVAV